MSITGQKLSGCQPPCLIRPSRGYCSLAPYAGGPAGASALARRLAGFTLSHPASLPADRFSGLLDLPVGRIEVVAASPEEALVLDVAAGARSQAAI
jgi:hypothetical protein